MTNRTKLTLFYFLAIIPFIPINYVSYNFHVWSKTCEVARILLLVFFAARMIKGHKKPSVPLTLAIIYFLGCFISTCLAKISYTPLVNGGVYLFGLTLLIEHGVSTDVDAMIDGMLLWFEIIIYANLLYYILNPRGYPVFSVDMIRRYYFFGNYNTTLRKLFPSLILGGIKAFRTKNRITLRFACMWFALMFFLLRVRSMTASIAMLVFASAILWYVFTKKSGIFKYEYFAILSVWISIQFAVLRKFAFAEFFITKVLKKNMVLSGRTPIWEKTISKICENPFFGFGQVRYKHVWEIISMNDPHNILLGTLFYGGILGLIILIVILVVYGRKIYSDRKQNRKFVFIFDACLCACFIEWCFEPASVINDFYRIFILLVMAYYCEKFENGITIPDSRSGGELT